jgi:exodeoxyribonuclease V alpha subunit
MSTGTAPPSLEALVDALPLSLGVNERADIGCRGLHTLAAVSQHESDFRAIVKLLAHRESQGFTSLGFTDSDAVEFDRYDRKDDAIETGSSADADDPSDFRDFFTAHLPYWDLLVHIHTAFRAGRSSYMVDFASPLPPNAEFVLDLKTKRLLFGRAADNERRLWAAIRGRAGIPQSTISSASDTILESLFPTTKPETIEADSRAEQIAAAKLIVSNSLSVLTGPPGTGKTFTLVRTALAWICSELEKQSVNATYAPRPIRLMAPTGRAASRMGELITDALGKLESVPAHLAALGHHGPAAITRLREATPTTIHRALQYSTKPGVPFRHTRDNPLDAGLVIVDETSMLGLELARRLLDALAAGSQLCLVGDPGQLRAVEMGSVLYDLVTAARTDASLTDCHASLTVSRRFPPGSLIDQLARAINGPAGAAPGKSLIEILEANRTTLAEVKKEFAAGLPVAGTSSGTATVRWLEVTESDLASSARTITELQATDLRNHAHDPDVSATLKRSVVLSVHRHGPTGAKTLATHAVKHLHGPAAPDTFEYPDGSSIMITRNNRALGLANGDLAIVDQRTMPGRAVFSKDKAYDLRILPNHESATALTVHKAQGSEWRNVFICLPFTSSPLVSASLLYTACTRATGTVVLVSTIRSLETTALRVS